MSDNKLVRGNWKLNHPVMVTMAVRNMYEQLENQNFFEPWFNVNPELDGFPVLYNDEEMSWLDGS